MRNSTRTILRISLLAWAIHGAVGAYAQSPVRDDFFPIIFYSYRGQGDLDLKGMIELLDDAQSHGWNAVNGVCGTHPDVKAIQSHIRDKGMAISAFCYGMTRIKGGRPIEADWCVHSPGYEAALHKFLEPRRAALENAPNFLMGCMRDETCVVAEHVCHCEHCRRLFKEKYGVAMPEAVPLVSEPVLRRQYLEFCDDWWLKVWKTTTDYMKANNPDLLIANTYTENVCFGRHYDLVSGDLLKWAGVHDWLAADIYPYYYKRHENDIEAIEWALKRSRLLMAFLRCAGRHHNIPFAWWVGCTSSPDETPRAIRHVAYTAIGQGAQGLIGWGSHSPERVLRDVNPKLWEDAGSTLRDIGKIGLTLRGLKKTSRIALLASESEAFFATPPQYAGFFYYDLVPAYDALLKAFGNADLIYERQIAAGKLHDYEALVMANVRHVADDAATAMEQFVSAGGVLISDTVPELNENNQPLETLAKMTGLHDRHGRPRRLSYAAPDDFPDMLKSDYGEGKVVVLRFRLGSFYRVSQLWELLGSTLRDCGVDPLAVSSNPDIESNYLEGDGSSCIIAVNRGREDGATHITCFRPPFTPVRVRDLITGEELPFAWSDANGPNALTIELNVDGLSGRVIGVYP